MSQQEKTEFLKIFSERLKAVRNRQGLSQVELAEKLKVKPSTIGNWESGQNGPGRKIGLIAAELGVSVDYLEGRDEEKPLREEPAPYRVKEAKWREVPVVSWASAGGGGNYSDLAEHLNEKVKTLCQDENAYALIVEGTSMFPDFKVGERFVVAANSELINGEFAVVRVAESGLTLLKKVFFIDGGKNVRLVSTNNLGHPDRVIAKAEFRFIQPVWGIADFHERRLKK